MAFLRRKREPDRGSDPGGSTGSSAGIAGSQPCAQPGCTNRNGAVCAYVDRRGRACGYAWCPDHQVVFGRQPYCRRHGGVMEAIASNPIDRVDPPDLDNRALSLCEWVSNDLDPDIMALLEELRDGAQGFEVQAHPLHMILQRSPPSRSWARVWTLSNQTGTLRKIGIEVNETDDSAVVASVDGNPVATDVPPWISDRGTPISEEAVQKRRDEFRIKLVGAVVWAAKNKDRPWVPK